MQSSATRSCTPVSCSLRIVLWLVPKGRCALDAIHTATSNALANPPLLVAHHFEIEANILHFTPLHHQSQRQFQ